MNRKLIVSKETFKELCMLLHCNSNYTGIYNCSIDTILLDVNEYGDKPKMTREEAVEKVLDATHNPVVRYRDEEAVLVSKLIKSLEAIGLIKFDEPKEEIDELFLQAVADARAVNLTNRDFVKDMNRRGYKIVKKD